MRNYFLLIISTCLTLSLVFTQAVDVEIVTEAKEINTSQNSNEVELDKRIAVKNHSCNERLQKSCSAILQSFHTQFLLKAIGKEIDHLSSGLQISSSVKIFTGGEFGVGIGFQNLHANDGILHFPCFMHAGYAYGEKRLKPVINLAYGYSFTSFNAQPHLNELFYTYKTTGGKYGHMDVGILYSISKKVALVCTLGYTISQFTGLINYSFEDLYKKDYITNNYTINFGIRI